MKIELTTLPHQKKAIESIIEIFKDAKILNNRIHPNSNPILDKAYINSHIVPNIKMIQQNNLIPNSMKNISIPKDNNPLVIDIKMETGTGKTCVYTELMLALNKYHFNKFLIVVPSTAIREGTKNFILSDSAKTYLRKDYENKEINLTVFESQKTQNGKNKHFPTAVREYFNGNILFNNKIYTLLIGQGMLKNSCAMGYDYEQSLIDEFSKPYEAIAHTRPIVIIDEPHRFKKDNKTYEYIVQNLNPQVIFRFGATFPDIKTKEGVIKDYENLIYDINAAKAFNDTLIKGVAPEYVGNIKDKPIKVVEISDKKGHQYVKFNKIQEEFCINDNSNLGTLDKRLEGITIFDIYKDEDNQNKAVVELSNGLKLLKGSSFFPETFGENYQITMIKSALTRHFKTELENVKREDKIKTLCLFFIDSIDSYRDNNATDKKGWLRLKFEEILNDFLKKQILIVEEEIQNGFELQDYKKYLQASIDNITETNGGYFCKDNNKSDEEIKKEVDDILKNKEKLLSFKSEDGTYNLRRFLFSKWTLREGWDNPNVFTIAKLRSSGSEISKLQEVGRGLRLPVDIDGNRKKEQFYLNYIVDASEKDFAQELIKQVNSEVAGQISIESFIKGYAELKGKKFFTVAANLSESDFINDNYILNMEKFDEFGEVYPEIAEKIQELPQINNILQNGKIIDRNKSKNKEKVKIRPEKFNELKDLWEILNRKYYVKFEDISEDIIIDHIEKSIAKSQNAINEIVTTRFQTIKNDNKLGLEEISGQTHIDNKTLKYSEVLKKVSKYTNLPISIIHKGFLKFHELHFGTDINSMLNENFVQKFMQSCIDWMKESISKYSYEKLDVHKKETALTYSNGKVKEYITKADIGVKMLDNFNTPDRFLYEDPVYDSELEKKNLKTSSQNEIIVFGKIPRRSIKIPTYFGETYSPDFMYVLKSDKRIKKLCCIVETKDVKSNSDKREIENKKIECAKKFYQKLREDLKDENIDVYYKEQKTNDSITEIIHELIHSD